MSKMENERQEKRNLITSKGVESETSGLSLEIGDEPELFKANTLASPMWLKRYSESLESEDEYKGAFSIWSSSIEEVEETQSELEIDIKDKTINNLTELLKQKEEIIKDLRFDISQKEMKIDNLQTTQKLKLEKTIEDNTKEIRSLKETINRYQEIIRPPSLTQKDIERYLSRFITEDEE